MLDWNGYTWRLSERWGNVHPGNPNVWMDPSCVSIDDNNHLKLGVKKNPQTLDLNGQMINPQIGIGLVSCLTEFGYGEFEIEAKLPTGPYLWPAFWLWSYQTWPPEIDVFEAYSNHKSSYWNWNRDWICGNFWNVETNVHLGATPNNWSLGGLHHWLGFTSPNKKFNKYTLIWEPNKIEILFNKRSVRKITDPKVTDQFKGHTMNVIINNGVQKEYFQTNHPESEMVVKYFKYTN